MNGVVWLVVLAHLKMRYSPMCAPSRLRMIAGGRINLIRTTWFSWAASLVWTVAAIFF